MVVIPFIGGPMDGKTILADRICSFYITVHSQIDGWGICCYSLTYKNINGTYVFELGENGKLWQEQSNRDDLRNI